VPWTAIGHDGSWNGHGWALCTADGPFFVGWSRHSHENSDRFFHLDRFLLGPYAEAVEMAREAGAPAAPLVALERPHKGKHRSAAVPYSLGQLTGALALDAHRRGLPAVELTPDEWRKWWRIGGRGRKAKKTYAVDLVELMNWGSFLDPYQDGKGPEGKIGDVAEAILIGTGAARRLRWRFPAIVGTRNPRKRPIWQVLGRTHKGNGGWPLAGAQLEGFPDPPEV